MARSNARDRADTTITPGIVDGSVVADDITASAITDSKIASGAISSAKLATSTKEISKVNVTFDSAQTLDLSQGTFFDADSTSGTNTTLSFSNFPSSTAKWSYKVKHAFGPTPPDTFAIASATNTTTETTDGVTFYKVDQTSSSNTNVDVTLTVTPGLQFYVGMIGASGASGVPVAPNDPKGGAGGVGVARVTVPAGVTTMIMRVGGGGSLVGEGVTGNNQVAGGTIGGGSSGVAGNNGDATYARASSGGGVVGLFKNSVSHANAIAVVGSGGGAGHAASVGYRGGEGGGFNAGGSGGFYNSVQGPGNAGGGGSTGGGGSYATTPTYAGNETAGSAGSALQGGTGGSWAYDAGGGGGAGYYGGGGGAAGGGYNSAGGGGGSGYLNTSEATSLATSTSQSNTGTTLQGYIRTHSGAANYTISDTSFGTPQAGGNSGKAGYAVLWNGTGIANPPPFSSSSVPAAVKNAVSNTPDSNNPVQIIEFITVDSGANIYITNDFTTT